MNDRTRRPAHGSGKYVLQLSYKQIECQRCRAPRIRGLPCPDCGAQPAAHEFDAERQRRQRTAAELLRYLDEPLLAERGTTESISDVYRSLADWTTAFLPALQALIEDKTDDGTQLRLSVDHLRQAESRLAWAPLRPWLAQHRVATQTLQLSKEAATAWLSAVAADTPLQAQQHGDVAQQRLDQAGATAAALGTETEAWLRISETAELEDTLSALYEEALLRGQHKGVLDLEQEGADDFRSLVGSPCPEGAGVVLKLSELIAGVVLDSDRFRATVRSAHEVLQRDNTRLAALLAAPSLPSDLLDGEVHNAMSWLAAQAVWAASRTDEQSLRELLKLGAALLEGAGKRYIAALTCMTRAQDYQQRRRMKPSQLLNEATKDGLADLFVGFDEVLRNKASHVDYRFDDDLVIFTDSGEETTPARIHRPDELVDLVLAATESCLALNVAVMATAAAHGTTLMDGRGALRRLGLTERQLTVLFLELGGLSEVSAVQDEDRLQISASCAADVRVLAALALAGATLPSEVASWEVSVAKGDELIRLQGPVEPWRRQAATDGTQDSTVKELALIDCMVSTTLNGQRWVSDEQLRKALSNCALQAYNATTYPAWVPMVTRIRKVATEAGDELLGKALRGLLTLGRLEATGGRLSHQETAVLRLLLRWTQDSTPAWEPV